MGKIKVLQQNTAAVTIGGTATEYRALFKSESLCEEYELVPMVLQNCHGGISLKDINFYRKSVKEANADIIHVRGAGVESFNAVLGAKLGGRGKVLVTVHGMFSDLVYYSPVKKLICKYVIEPLIFAMADGISCVCKAAEERECFKSFANKMLPFVYNRMPVFEKPNGREAFELREKLGFSAEDKVGVFVGRVTKEKGLEHLLGALKKLDKNPPKGFCLLVVGDGEYLSEFKAECDKLKNIKTVFTGAQKNVEKFLFAADFFIQPSLHENHSVALLEACAAKLPCLLTNVGGNPEIIKEGVTGVFVPPASTDALEQGICRLCNANTLFELKKGMEECDFSAFSSENTEKQLKEVYTKLLNKN